MSKNSEKDRLEYNTGERVTGCRDTRRKPRDLWNSGKYELLK